MAYNTNTFVTGHRRYPNRLAQRRNPPHGTRTPATLQQNTTVGAFGPRDPNAYWRTMEYRAGDSNGSRGRLSTGLQLRSGSSSSTSTAGEGPPHPPDLTDKFPEHRDVYWPGIPDTKVPITDPIKYGKKFGEHNRAEMLKNYEMSKRLGLDLLDVELEGLRGFVPGASALRREQAALDTQFRRNEWAKDTDFKRSQLDMDQEFNQAMRDRQIDSTMPDARRRLMEQGERAEGYASGRLPDSMQDRALELGVRSRAADSAAAGGFGARSSVARKTSDLMSAEQRLNIGMMGENLLASNLQQASQTLLAPTAYSQAGAEIVPAAASIQDGSNAINVMPEVGAGRMTANMLSETNANTLINPNTALGSVIQQDQFQAGITHDTNKFNASGDMAAQQFNAAAANQFALGKFGYQTAQAGMQYGRDVAAYNEARGIAQQETYTGAFNQGMGQAQSSGQTAAIASGLGQAIPAIIDAFRPSGGGGGQQDTAGGSTGGGGISGGTSGGGGAAGGGGTSGGGSGLAGLPTGGGSGGDPPGTVHIPSGGSAPSGYEPIRSNPDGTVTYVPENYYKSQTGGFQAATGISLERSATSTSPSTASLVEGGKGVLKIAGMSDVPAPNLIPSGADESGKMMYSQPAVAKSKNTQEGGDLVSSIRDVLDPTGALTDEDSSTLDKIEALARDGSVMAQLAYLHEIGDKKGFIDLLLQRVGVPVISQLAGGEQGQRGVQTAFSAYSLYSNWNHMSDAQRGLGVAGVGLQAANFGGYNLSDKPIIKPVVGADGSITRPGMNVGQALGLLQAGYNVYSMINNWDQLNDVQRVIGGVNTVGSLAQTGRNFGLLGSGTSGAAVGGVTAQSLASQGFSPAVHYGVGAIQGPASAPVPAGYTAIVSDGGYQVAIPKGLEASGQGAVGAGNIDYTGGFLGAASFAAGAYQVYRGWGNREDHAEGALNGALGGVAMASGLYGMASSGLIAVGFANPFLLGAIVILSAASGLIKAGKHVDQKARDVVRSDWVKRGFVDNEYNVTLADGSKYNIGTDGQQGRHTVTNPDKIGDNESLNQRSDKHLNSYDVDYTNPLDYGAYMGTGALMTMLYGGGAHNTRQMGGQLANAAISSVGYNQELTPENFSTVMGNIRAFYSQNGITNKAAAYQLANQAFAEGRVNETELITMHQGINMVFDEDGYNTAAQLLTGHDRGIQLANEKVNEEEQVEAAETSDTEESLVFKGASGSPAEGSSSEVPPTPAIWGMTGQEMTRDNIRSGLARGSSSSGMGRIAGDREGQAMQHDEWMFGGGRPLGQKPGTSRGQPHSKQPWSSFDEWLFSDDEEGGQLIEQPVDSEGVPEDIDMTQVEAADRPILKPGKGSKQPSRVSSMASKGSKSKLSLSSLLSREEMVEQNRRRYEARA